MKVLKKIAAAIDRLGDYWALIVLLIVILPALESVVFRSILNRPTLWTAELATMIFGAYFMIGGAYCEKTGSHVAMDIFYSKYRGYFKIFVDTLAFLCCLAVCGLLVYFSAKNVWKVFIQMDRSDTAWGPLLWPSRIAMPIGGFLLLFRSFVSYLEKVQTSLLELKGGGTER